MFFWCACARPGGGLVVANGADAQLLDPQLATGAPEGRILSALFEGLTRLDSRTLAPVPGLAESWTSSGGGQEWRFLLRPGLRWSDGTILAPAEIPASWLGLLDPARGAPYRDWLLALEGAEEWCAGRPWAVAARRAVAPWAAAWWIWSAAPPAGLQLRGRELVVRFRHPVPSFAEMCAHHALAPVPREMRLPAAGGAAAPGEAPAGGRGCGPFRLAERRIRDRVRVEPNPHYWNAKAVRLAAIDFLTVESQFTALNLFLAGEAHYLPDLPVLAVPALREREAERRLSAAARGRAYRAEFEPTPYLATYFYRLNVTRPPLDDVRVRRALSLAIDRPALAAALGAGHPPAAAFVPPWIAGYAPPEPGGFDPDEARRLLAAAGYPEGRGFPELEILYNSAELHRDVAAALQQQWRHQLGVATRLQNQEWKVFLDAQQRLEYDLSRSSWIGDYLDPLSFLAIFRSASPNNRTGWSDARYDAGLDQALRAAGAEERFRLLRRAEEQLLQEAPVIPLFHYLRLELVSARVAGLAANLRGYVDWSQVALDTTEDAAP